MRSAEYKLRHAEYMRKWRKEHPQEAREVARRWKKNHPETVRMLQDKWEHNNREKHLAHRVIDNLVNNSGFIKPENCMECGDKCITQAHHKIIQSP